MKGRCVCGCRQRGRHSHHVVYQQEIRRRVAKGKRGRWLRDERNLVTVNLNCHAHHHSGAHRLPVRVLPDSVFEFAVELMGAGAAYEYLERRYAGRDPRLDALLAV